MTKLRRLPAIREQDVQADIFTLLSYRGFRIFRRNTGAMTIDADPEHGKRGRYIKFSETGAADLTGRHKTTGRTIEVECKRPGEKPSPEQYAWLDLAKVDGCIAFWADSVPMCDAKLREYGY